MKNEYSTRRNFLKKASAGPLAAAGITAQSCARRNVKAPKKRIMVGSFSHETNTFNPNITTLEGIKRNARYGDDVLMRGGEMVHGTYGDCIGGFIDVLEMYDIELIGSIRAGGGGEGTVQEDAFDYVRVLGEGLATEKARKRLKEGAIMSCWWIARDYIRESR